jgi:hypothetical protein
MSVKFSFLHEGRPLSTLIFLALISVSVLECDETESSCDVNHYWVYCTSPWWWMMSAVQNRKTNVAWPGLEWGRRRSKPATNHLSYDTTLFVT